LGWLFPSEVTAGGWTVSGGPKVAWRLLHSNGMMDQEWVGIHRRDGRGGMNRAYLQKLANDRVADAKLLLSGKRWGCAYYVAGYAVECGLKACILAHIEKTGFIFEDKKYAEKCWTHDLEELMRLAHLQVDFDVAMSADVDHAGNWEIVKDWTEASRYLQTTKTDAQELYRAITDNNHGVLTWVRLRW
jgi:HEPN domain-containing protein